ncbi:MAG: BrnT family toxin [SAR202 cluster bacterium]|nr:BrnT family toxin [SAR202 cluster bacterium]
MNIVELEWDDRNIKHIARHSVSPEEVEDVCFGFHFARSEHGGRYVLSGQSDAGRYLNVIVEDLGRGRFRPITAFEMSDNYKASYRRRMSKRE